MLGISLTQTMTVTAHGSFSSRGSQRSIEAAFEHFRELPAYKKMKENGGKTYLPKEAVKVEKELKTFEEELKLHNARRKQFPLYFSEIRKAKELLKPYAQDEESTPTVTTPSAKKEAQTCSHTTSCHGKKSEAAKKASPTHKSEKTKRAFEPAKKKSKVK